VGPATSNESVAFIRQVEHIRRRTDSSSVALMNEIELQDLPKVRRVVLDAKGTVINLGQARHFTGNSRAAVKLSAKECIWPSCRVPTTRCETDHMVEHSRKGRTDPGHGAPLCAKHNLWKQKGFTVHKDNLGNWHTHRPDGTEIDR
jgi:hypothetical protein